MVEKWKLSLKEFLKKYEEDDDVVGAILCGSYATGNQSEDSMVDVYLVLKDYVNYEEKGITESNSFLIKYFIRNTETSKRLMEYEYENRSIVTAHMLAYGKIIYDLEGKAKELQDEALCYVDKPIIKISGDELLINNYKIWNYNNNLKSLMKEENPCFYKTYYKLLEILLNSYCEFLEIPKIADTKIYKIFTDEKFKNKYHVFKLPEEEFINLYIKCYEVAKPSIMYKNINEVIKYYYSKIGGFNIKNFIIKN